MLVFGGGTHHESQEMAAFPNSNLEFPQPNDIPLVFHYPPKYLSRRGLEPLKAFSGEYKTTSWWFQPL